MIIRHYQFETNIPLLKTKTADLQSKSISFYMDEFAYKLPLFMKHQPVDPHKDLNNAFLLEKKLGPILSDFPLPQT